MCYYICAQICVHILMSNNWLNALLQDQKSITTAPKKQIKVDEDKDDLISPTESKSPNLTPAHSAWNPMPEQVWSPPLRGFKLYQKALAWERAVKLALKPYQLTHLQWLVLTYLTGLATTKHKPTVMEIAHCLQLDPPTTTQVLTALTRKNLVHKLRQGNAYQVSATADGRIVALKSRSLVLGVEPIRSY